MKILLVDDDTFKRKTICNFIYSINDGIEIETAMSYESGKRLSFENKYDLILLDMTLTQFDQIEETESGIIFKDEGKTFKNGGELIVEELKEFGIDFRCAIITQYDKFNFEETIDKIDKRLTQLCGTNYLGPIKFNIIKDNWKDDLKTIIKNVEHIVN